jgi:hypothetical protein
MVGGKRAGELISQLKDGILKLRINQLLKQYMVYKIVD